MKRLFSALLCLALIAGSAACSDDETTRPVLVVNAGESFLSLDALARAGKISVTSSLPWRRGQVVYALRHGRPGGIFRDRGDLRPERRPRPQCAAGFCQRGPDRAVRHVAERAEGRLRRAPDYYFYAGFGTMPPSMPDCMCCPTTNRVISIIRVRERSTRISSRRMSKSRRRPTGPRMPPKPKRTRCAAK